MDPQGRPKPIPNEEKLKLWMLAGRIQNAVTPIDLTIDDVKKIKDRAGDMWSGIPLIYARLHEAFEKAASAKDVQEQPANSPD